MINSQFTSPSGKFSFSSLRWTGGLDKDSETTGVRIRFLLLGHAPRAKGMAYVAHIGMGHTQHTRKQKMAIPKITAEDAAAIKRRLANGDSGRSIAKDYPISQQNVSHIALGRIWGKVKPKE